jgi:hypothetical protein
MAALKSISSIQLSISGAAVFSGKKTAAGPVVNVVKLIDQDPGRRIDRGVSPIHGPSTNPLPLLVPVGLKMRYSNGRGIALARNGKESAAAQFFKKDTL